jgi:hypothetical protein
MDTVATHMATTMDMVDTVTTVAGVTESAMAADQVTDMGMAAEPIMDTAMAADQGIPGVREVGDKPCYGFLKIRGRGYVGVFKRAVVPCWATSLVSELDAPTAK